MSINWPDNIINIQKTDYFNLLDDDISNLTIVEYHQSGNCLIVDLIKQKAFRGFILAKSPRGEAVTLCEIDFHKSKDNRYQPRLTFRRTDQDFKDKKLLGESITQRITFQGSNDGYHEFWKMIGFLKGFKDLVDTGNFDEEYKVLNQKEVITYLDKKNLEDTERMVNDLGITSTTAFQYLSTVKLLKIYKEKIKEFIDTNAIETTVQKWIDEDNHKNRKDRCMIFGLEFVDHKREGGTNGNRYDIFTKIGFSSEERVLIELKSPSDDLFDEKKTETVNDEKIEYSLSPSLSRAIPQILEYRKDMEEKRAGDSELQKVGETNEIKISKCIIVIGHSKNDTRWRKNLFEFRRSLSSNLEIWTYTDLLEKLSCTIKNLSDRNN